MAINLAPNHKQGLQLTNPVIIGGGSVGYGEAIFSGIDPTTVGAIVIGPIMYHSSGGSEWPRVAESNGSFVLHTGLQNRGVSSTLKRYSPIWSRLGSPIIAQVADSQPELLQSVVDKLSDAFSQGAPIRGIELLLPINATEERTELLVQSITRHTDIPLIVNLPLPIADFLAEPAVYAGADALVIGHSPRGSLYRSMPGDNSPRMQDRQGKQGKQGKQDAETFNRAVLGSARGPGQFSQMLETLSHIQSLNLECTLIGAGGIHTVAQARQTLAAGAVAFQIDSVLWVEPGIVQQMVDNVSL